MPSVASVTSPSAARTANVASGLRSEKSVVASLSFLGATQLAQAELERRALSGAHTIASVVFLKGIQPGTGHYDVRIEPPATLADGGRLRGFCVAMDGTLLPALGFRTEPGLMLSTPSNDGSRPQSGLASGERAG
jgi:hypothetical protein